MWWMWMLAPAVAGELDGTWKGPGLELVLQDDGAGGYSGSASLSGATYPLAAQPGPMGLSGVVTVDGEVVAFVAAPIGQGLIVTSADGVWQVQRQGPAAGTASPVVADIVAQSPYASVTADAAVAFREALLFSMAFAGAPEADQAQITQDAVNKGLAADLATLPPEDQVALANARVVWTQTRAAWDTMPLADKREFAGAVLTLAFGPEAARFGGPAGKGAASGSGYIDVDSMVGPIPGSDCWASAGCNYDSSTGTYEMEVYEPPMEVYTPSFGYGE